MSRSISRKLVSSCKAGKPVGPYNHAVVVDNTVYVSGVIGLDPRTSILVPGGVESQTRQALRSLKAILETSGSNLCKVVKTTILLTNINDFNIVNEVYKEFFEKDFPARMCYQVAKLPKEASVEIDALALVGNVTTEYLTDNPENVTCKM